MGGDMETESQYVVRGIARGLNTYSYRVAHIAETLNDMAKMDDVNDKEVEFAALLTTLIAMGEYLNAHWRVGVNRFLEDNQDNLLAIKKYENLSSAMVNADVGSIQQEAQEHFHNNPHRFAEDENGG
jgi:hypothetical protein